MTVTPAVRVVRSSNDWLAELVETLRVDPRVRACLAAALELTPERTLHTTATLAAELGVSARTVVRAIEAGELAATRRAGRWVMTVEDVREWARSGRPSSRDRAAEPARRSSRPSGVMAEAMRAQESA